VRKIQTAVEAKHHLIFAHEVANKGSDRIQLSPMATQAREAMDAEELTVVADAGYFRSEEILSCHEAGSTANVPKPRTSGNHAKGFFDKNDFRYIPESDEYRCPANERLIWRMTTQEHGLRLHRYWSSNCQRCAIKPHRTTGMQRRVTRWEHEVILEAMQERLDRAPETMRIRRQTVEHPFGTLKAWMGSTHFLTRTLDRVRAEMSLHVLAYNLKRAMNILGIKLPIQTMQA
jgi:transposase